MFSLILSDKRIVNWYGRSNLTDLNEIISNETQKEMRIVTSKECSVSILIIDKAIYFLASNFWLVDHSGLYWYLSFLLQLPSHSLVDHSH